MSATEHPNVVRVRAHAERSGVTIQVRRFPVGTRTAAEAAREIGTGVERIVKSLVFRAGDETLIVLCAGAARVDEAKLALAAGAPVRRATAEEAKTSTGYAIGGVPPFAHAQRCRIFCDEGLLAHDEVWAAGGLPDAVFPIAPRDLVRLSGAVVADLAAYRSSSSSSSSSSDSNSSE